MSEKLADAKQVLAALDLPSIDVTAYTLLAFSGLSPDGDWSDVRYTALGTSDVIARIAQFGRQYAPNTRETVRKSAINPFVQRGILLKNPNDPSLPRTSKDTHYALSEPALAVLGAVGTAAFEQAVAKFDRQFHSKPRRLQKFVVEGLFGEVGSLIEIDFRLADRVTVLHGPNGSGKTITLRLIDAVLNGRYGELYRLPFARIVVELADGAQAEIKPIEHARNQLEISTQTQHSGAVTSEQVYSPSPADLIVYRSDELSELEQFEQFEQAHWPTWARLRGSLPPVKFVGINRLVTTRQLDLDPVLLRLMRSIGGADIVDADDSIHTRKAAVERIGQDIRAEVENADRSYRELTTNLDATLAHRILSGQVEPLEPEALQILQKEIVAREERLLDIGLLQSKSAYDIAADPLEKEDKSARVIVSAVLSDRRKKLEAFATMAEKAEFVVNSLNRKFSPKTVRLDAETGYHVVSASGNPIDLLLLSSGEQHELILMHELLFDIEHGTLLLIDEPELSMHPTWQLEVLPEMLKIALLSKLDIVLATHSPYIAEHRTDLMVQVGGRQQ